MPRVSIIIPYQRDDARLESTLLSVLENRPDDCEIIIAHDGSYGNPYHLEDEVIFVDVDAPAGDVRLLNAGLYAACAPAIHTLWPGMLVSADWLREPLEWLDQTAAAAVAIPIVGSDGRTLGGVPLIGPVGPAFWKGPRQGRDTSGVGPMIACGVYRRRVLLALEGFFPGPASAAGLEAAWAIAALSLPIEASGTAVHYDGPASRLFPTDALASAARVAAAYEKCAADWPTCCRNLTTGLLTGQLGPAFAWVRGLKSAGEVRSVIEMRLSRAAHALENQHAFTIPFPDCPTPPAAGRRAA